MLNHISIKNFAVIENTEVDFEDGLNIITGETGAGKSIVIEAVSLALGSRADTTLVRTGADKAVIQLTGSLDGEEIVILREVSAQGKNLCKLNGEIVTLAKLNEATGRLADIHGQYDNQSLLNPDYHIELLDCYKADKIAEPKQAVSDAYHALMSAKSALSALLATEKENLRQQDFLRFELEEINKANLVISEDTELAERATVLQNSEKIFDAVEGAYQTIYDATPSVMDGLGRSMNALEGVANYSRELEDVSKSFGDVYYKLEDVASSLRSIKESLTFSPQELDEVIARLNLIEHLKKKYDKSIEEILEYRDEITQKLSVIANFDDEKLRLERELQAAKHEYVEKARSLSAIRKETALELQSKIQAELADLNFKNAKLEIPVEQTNVAAENGLDKVEIMISTNAGEPLKPLYRIASGGEMSRIMLAFKNVISSYDNIPTLIFDEIDNGISGVTASIVGQKLKEISRSHQIICITHLPQIAACGDCNYRILKDTDDSRTYTTVEKLGTADKVKEIARLLGGSTVTETTLKSAMELIANS